jgi:hypothetical protein
MLPIVATIVSKSLKDHGVLMAEKRIFRNRIVAIIFIPLGLFMLFFSAILPFLLKDPILGFILMGVPMIFGALIMLLHGAAAAFTRIEIAESGLVLAVPGWRGFPVPPIRKATLSWDEVLAVRNRVELYYVTILPYALAMPFPVMVFAIDTTRGRYILGGKIRWLSQAMQEIAYGAGRSVRYEGEVEARLFSTLLHGAPEWQHIPQEQFQKKD